MSPGQDMCEVQGTDLGDVSSLSLQHVATGGSQGNSGWSPVTIALAPTRQGQNNLGGLLGGGGNW